MNFEIEIDLALAWENFLAFSSQDPLTIAWQLFWGGGWLVIMFLFIGVLYQVWLDGRRAKYVAKWEHAILAIDIPKNNEQTPQAIENIFVTLAGAQSSGNLVDKYWTGKVQESFSFEIISLEGFIQFLVRTPKHFRDLVEAAVYAQYPDAEINEIEDYAQPYKDLRFPNEKYNLWGTELLLVKDYPYPIRTYPEFEYILGQTFIDPMAGVLEALSRFSLNEQLWLQLVVTPQPPGWGEKAKKVVKALMGEKVAPAENALLTILTKPFGWFFNFFYSIWEGTFGPITSEVKKEESKTPTKLSPGETRVLEKVQRKLSKHSFRVKFRMIYFGEQVVFNKGRGVAGVIGAIQQFNTSDANGFKPGNKTKTSVDYFRVKQRVAQRQNKILKQYIKRDNYNSDDVSNMLLNTEELASLWHFPILTVKAPLVEKIISRKAVPPSRLPYEETASKIIIETAGQSDNRKKPAPPPNLPTV